MGYLLVYDREEGSIEKRGGGEEGERERFKVREGETERETGGKRNKECA